MNNATTPTTLSQAHLWIEGRDERIAALEAEIATLRAQSASVAGAAQAQGEQAEGVRDMRASLQRARGLLVELDSVLRMAESHNGGVLTVKQVRAAVEPYLPLDATPNAQAVRPAVGGSEPAQGSAT